VTRGLTLDLYTHFFQFLLDQRKVELLEDQLKIAEENLATARRRLSIGRSQRLDVLRAQTQIVLIKPKIERARGDRAVSAAVLAYDLGKPSLSSLEIKGSLEPPSDERINAWINGPRQALPELQKKRAERELLEKKSLIAMGRHWPEGFFKANWGRNTYQKSELLDSLHSSWEVSLGVNVPIFSGLISRYESQDWTSQALQLEKDEKALQDQVSLQEIKGQKSLEVLRETVKSGEAALGTASESLTEAKRNYSLSTIDYQVYLSIQQDWAEVRLALDQNRTDYLVALAKTLAAKGVDLTPLILERSEVK
jgi:outer membrane protein TolC